MEASLNLLKEEAKLKVIVAFQNDCIEIGGKIFTLEKHISTEKGDQFVYDLNVACF